jgi:hypothetical protein
MRVSRNRSFGMSEHESGIGKLVLQQRSVAEVVVRD